MGPPLQPSLHRKVELQSPQDLTHLLATATRAAREKIDLHLPPSAAVRDGGGGGDRDGNGGTVGEDGFRRRVEEEVLDYIRSTFALASHSISVNGLDCPSLDAALDTSTEDFEPYDPHLTTTAATLSAQIENLILSTTALRRRAAPSVTEKYADALEAALAADDAAFLAALPEDSSPRDAACRMEDAEVLRLQRREEMERAWGRSLTGLVELREGLPGTVAKLERAGRAVEYLEGGSEGGGSS
ncbi:MAG: hypothetical protein M1817_004171 [Caeruleum heppii]|nr:MAG: hypothetical protein M1817_004171 [Caeruleum heppii]